MVVNKIEVLKTAKDGLDVLADLHRYAALAAAGDDPQIPAEDCERLKWYGLFHRKRTPGHFMLRMRIPGGVLNAEQITAIGEISNAVGRGQADITSRMNIQLRWITIADAPWVLQRLSAAGLTTQQSGMDNVRNIVSCPLSGLTEDEVIDTRVLATRMQQAIIGSKRFSNLPRKFNLSVTGCREDCGHAQVHDLSFVPAQRDGVRSAAGCVRRRRRRRGVGRLHSRGLSRPRAAGKAQAVASQVAAARMGHGAFPRRRRGAVWPVACAGR